MSVLGIGKAAGAVRAREVLAASYLPVCEAVVAGFGPVAEEIARPSRVEGLRRLGESVVHLAGQEAARREEVASRVAEAAARRERPQFRDLAGEDVARMGELTRHVAAGPGEAPAGLQVPHVNGGA